MDYQIANRLTGSRGRLIVQDIQLQWSTMEPTWSPEDYQDEAAYSSDDSSDGSIPNIQPLNLFTAFNSSARASRPAPTESSGDDSGAEEVDVIRSDLPQSASQQVNGGDLNHPDPVSAETPLPGSAIPPLSGQRYSVVGGKRIMTAAAKEHHSQIMKSEWACRHSLCELPN